MCVKRQSSFPFLGAACAAALALTLGQSAHAQLENAPTINALSQLQRAEIEKAAQKRMEQLNPPPPPPLVPVAAPVVKVEAAPKPKPVVTKTIWAIYGRQGAELTEIAMPDGSVVKAVAGQHVQDFKVVSVGNGVVVIERPMAEAAKKGATRRHSASHASSSKSRPDNRRAAPAASPRVHTIQLVTGDKFD